MDKKFKKNIEILEENDIRVCNTEPVWDDKPNSVELETYTDAGEDMIINLDEPSKNALQSYIDGFDINDAVMLWWSNGADAAHDKGVPFDNIEDHYEDYRSYIKELQRVCDLLD